MKAATQLCGALMLFAICGVGSTARASIVAGTITGWEESTTTQTIGDGVNEVTLWWSLYHYDKGWLYGTGDTKAAFAPDITHPAQITDASTYTFSSGGQGICYDADVDPEGVGDFVIFKNTATNHYAVLRVDDIIVQNLAAHQATLDASWGFQTDGSGDFSSVPEPSTAALLVLALVGSGALVRRGPLS